MRERELPRISPKSLALWSRRVKMLFPERGLGKENVGIVSEFDSVQRSLVHLAQGVAHARHSVRSCVPPSSLMVFEDKIKACWDPGQRMHLKHSNRCEVGFHCGFDLHIPNS